MLPGELRCQLRIHRMQRLGNAAICSVAMFSAKRAARLPTNVQPLGLSTATSSVAFTGASRTLLFAQQLCGSWFLINGYITA